MKQDELSHFLATIAITTDDEILKEDIREVQETQDRGEDYYDFYDSIGAFDGTFVDAIGFAMNQVPKVNHEVWLGQIGDENKEDETGLWGTYYADSKESRWFPRTSVETASLILAKEIT